MLRAIHIAANTQDKLIKNAHYAPRLSSSKVVDKKRRKKEKRVCIQTFLGFRLWFHAL